MVPLPASQCVSGKASAAGSTVHLSAPPQPSFKRSLYAYGAHHLADQTPIKYVSPDVTSVRVVDIMGSSHCNFHQFSIFSCSFPASHFV
jgi:hypothetical protein